jgi:hypothetical protein
MNYWDFLIGTHQHFILQGSLIIKQCVLDTTLCDKVCQCLATCQWFSPSTPVSSTNKTDRYDITEVLLTVTLNIIIHTLHK